MVCTANLLDFGGIETAVQADEERIAVVQDLGKAAEKGDRLVQGEVGDTGAQCEDSLLAMDNGGCLEPLAAIVVGAEQAKAADMLVARQLGKSAFEFLARQVEGVVLDVLVGLFEGLQDQVHLPEVSGKRENVSGIEWSQRGACKGRSASQVSNGCMKYNIQDLPAAELDDHGPLRDALGNVVCMRLEDLDFAIGQVILVQVCDLLLTSC